MSQPDTIWWCEEHRMQFFPAPIGECAWWSSHKWQEDSRRCRGVQRRLVSPSALVIERDENGEWPEWVSDVAFRVATETGIVGFASNFLDALAASQRV